MYNPEVAVTPYDEIIRLLARRVTVPPAMIAPFAEFDEALTALLRSAHTIGNTMLVAGHMTPAVAIAADRAGIIPVELLGTSPFTGSRESVIEHIESPSQLVYVANPNRVTGANYSLSDLRLMAKAVPDGLLIVDEYYYDYFGITALPLISELGNVAVLRSFAAGFGITSVGAGYIIAADTLIAQMQEHMRGSRISSSVTRQIGMTLQNESVLAGRLKLIHEESLRLASGLTNLGVHARITAADFILVRVKDPVQAGNFLASYKVPVENLDGYPELKGYLCYRLQSDSGNDRLLEAFAKMPTEYYRTRAVDRRPMTLRHGADEAESPTITRVSVFERGQQKKASTPVTAGRP